MDSISCFANHFDSWDFGCNFPVAFEALVYNLIFLCLLKKLIDTRPFLVRQC